MQRKISPVDLIGLLLMAVLMLPMVRAEAGYLEDISARGVIRIGTTGDYIPMSYLNPQTGAYCRFPGGKNPICANYMADACR